MIRKISRCNIIYLYEKQREHQSQQKNKKRNNDFSKAIEIHVFDQSYSYFSYINNYLYLEKNNRLFKVNVSTLTPERIAEIIEFLQDK